jgi:hypothetical protein
MNSGMDIYCLGDLAHPDALRPLCSSSFFQAVVKPTISRFQSLHQSEIGTKKRSAASSDGLELRAYPLAAC